jgi:hypothetical protein
VVQVGDGPQPQVLRLFPSTSLPEAYLIHPGGCAKISDITFNGMSCEDSRGGLFKSNLSTSYVNISVYDVSANAAFHTFGFTKLPAHIGRDFFELNLPKTVVNTVNPSSGRLDNLIVAGIKDLNYTWLGMLGLDARESYFSGLGGFSTPQDTLLTRLKRNGLIPSLSWSYTAGSCLL